MIQKFTLESHHDRLLLQGLLVLPEQKPPRAVFQVAHGMCEHKERYLPFLQEMADHGYVCVIHDHRGHGGSVRQTEDLGYFYPDGGPALVSDLYQVTRWIREQYPELPLYLFGHSMGSLAVRCYLKRYPDVPDGVFVAALPALPSGWNWENVSGQCWQRKRAHPTRASGWRMLSFPDSRNRSGMRAGTMPGSAAIRLW